MTWTYQENPWSVDLGDLKLARWDGSRYFVKDKHAIIGHSFNNDSPRHTLVILMGFNMHLAVVDWFRG